MQPVPFGPPTPTGTTGSGPMFGGPVPESMFSSSTSPPPFHQSNTPFEFPLQQQRFRIPNPNYGFRPRISMEMEQTRFPLHNTLSQGPLSPSCNIQRPQRPFSSFHPMPRGPYRFPPRNSSPRFDFHNRPRQFGPVHCRPWQKFSPYSYHRPPPMEHHPNYEGNYNMNRPPHPATVWRRPPFERPAFDSTESNFHRFPNANNCGPVQQPFEPFNKDYDYQAECHNNGGPFFHNANGENGNFTPQFQSNQLGDHCVQRFALEGPPMSFRYNGYQNGGQDMYKNNHEIDAVDEKYNHDGAPLFDRDGSPAPGYEYEQYDPQFPEVTLCEKVESDRSATSSVGSAREEGESHESVRESESECKTYTLPKNLNLVGFDVMDKEQLACAIKNFLEKHENQIRLEKPRPVREVRENFVYADNVLQVSIYGHYQSTRTGGNGKNSSVASYGICFKKGNDLNCSGRLKADYPQTQIGAELLAAEHSILLAKHKVGVDAVNIITDSNYLVQNVDDWLRRTSSSSDGHLVPETWIEMKHVNQIRKLCTALEGVRVAWTSGDLQDTYFQELQIAKDLSIQCDDIIEDFIIPLPS